MIDFENLPRNRPIIDEHPGPPLILERDRKDKTAHFCYVTRVNGAVSGALRDSENQNH